MLVKRIRCGHCGELTDATLIGLQPFDYRDPRPEPERTQPWLPHTRRKGMTPPPMPDERADIDTIKEVVGYGNCTNCGGPIMAVVRMWMSDFKSMKGQDAEWRQVTWDRIPLVDVWPAQPSVTISPHLPAQIALLFSDAWQATRAPMSAPARAAPARLCIEAVLKDTSDKARGSVFEIINTLRDDGTLTKALADWGHRIRLLGNAAQHDASTTDAEAAEIYEFLELLIEIAYVVPGRIAARSIEAPPEG